MSTDMTRLDHRHGLHGQGAKCGCACCVIEARRMDLVSPPWPSDRDWVGYFRGTFAFRDFTRPLSRWFVSFTVLRPRRAVMSVVAKRRGREFRAGSASTGTLILTIVLSVVVLCAVLVLILPWPLPYHQSLDEIMHERTAYLQEQCRSASVKAEGLGTTPRYYYQQAFHNYFYQPRVGLLWCSISKVASSSWMYQFNQWAGVPRETIDRMATEMKALARVHYPLPTRTDVEQMKLLSAAGVANERLMVVRDPMDRFVSTYEDLIVRPKSSNYLHLRRFILREVHGVNVAMMNETVPVPSFAEFTEFVLRRTNLLDPHWNTYWNLCDPCFLEPTFIVKLETYDRDVAHLLQRLNLTASETDRFEGHRLNVNHDRGGRDQASAIKSRSLTMARLAELTADQFERLYHRYELDFRLFQYDASQYFALFK
ncbi:carbohydrate sulfotransferase 13-like [Anopheles aquasalis]|uniref:carbohydrate sulfotransferase 13-like n=1 Tax=Anopheles aquasalis TaxID=42839 RepID=UPI00215AC79E|nr:carbohydrate sulfotransferase 13-like [Anopheles aquasalis]